MGRQPLAGFHQADDQRPESRSQQPEEATTTSLILLYTLVHQLLSLQLPHQGGYRLHQKDLRSAVLPAGRAVPGRPTPLHQKDLQRLRRRAPTVRSRKPRPTPSCPQQVQGRISTSTTRARPPRCSRTTDGRWCLAGPPPASRLVRRPTSVAPVSRPGAKLSFNLQFASGKGDRRPVDGGREIVVGPRQGSP